MIDTWEMEEGQAGIAVLDESGDTRMQWSKNNPAEVAKAETRFNELKKSGYMGYSVSKDGSMGEVLQAFDPTAERIIMHRQLVGG